MCCEHLVCASCAHPVGDARCPICRATRDRMHPRQAASPATLALLVALLMLAALLSAHLVR